MANERGVSILASCPKNFLSQTFAPSEACLSRMILRSAKVRISRLPILSSRKYGMGSSISPEDVSIRISDHNGTRLKLLYSLWGDWLRALGDPEKPDEIFGCMLDAADCFQCAHFNFLHGYYRAAMAELRVALELVMIGMYGTLNPTDPKYTDWKTGSGGIRLYTLSQAPFGNLAQGRRQVDVCRWRNPCRYLPEALQLYAFTSGCQ